MRYQNAEYEKIIERNDGDENDLLILYRSRF